jgi:hypothetical protein
LLVILLFTICSLDVRVWTLPPPPPPLPSGGGKICAGILTTSTSRSRSPSPSSSSFSGFTLPQIPGRYCNADMDPSALFASSHSRYQTEQCRTPLHFPNQTDKAACARFRLARRRRASARAAPVFSQSSSAVDSVELWCEIVSLRDNFNELSSLALKQGRIIDGLLQLQVSAAALPCFPLSRRTTTHLPPHSLHSTSPASSLTTSPDLP